MKAGGLFVLLIIVLSGSRESVQYTVAALDEHAEGWISGWMDGWPDMDEWVSGDGLTWMDTCLRLC